MRDRVIAGHERLTFIPGIASVAPAYRQGGPTGEITLEAISVFVPIFSLNMFFSQNVRSPVKRRTFVVRLKVNFSEKKG